MKSFADNPLIICHNVNHINYFEFHHTIHSVKMKLLQFDDGNKKETQKT